MIQTLADLRLELNKQSGVLFLAQLGPEVYRSHEALSQSSIKVIADKSPLHYHHYKRYPRPSSDSQKLGTVAHCAVLEPLTFQERFFVMPKVNLRTNLGKSQLAEAEVMAKQSRRQIVTKDVMDHAESMRDSIRRQGEVSELLEGGVTERASFGFMYDLHTKIQTDYYKPAPRKIVDLKSCKSANPIHFERDIKKFRYHWQAAWYVDLMTAITGELHSFEILAVESTPPYATCIYTFSFKILTLARQEIRETLQTLKDCDDTGKWPGFKRHEASVSKYEWEAYKKLNNERLMR